MRTPVVGPSRPPRTRAGTEVRPAGAEGTARPDDPGEGSDTLERCAWSLVWLGALVGGLDLWSSWSSWPAVSILAPLMILVAIAGLVGSWLVDDPRSPLLQVSALAASLVATLGHEAIGIHVRQYYTTDSGAFNQVAARLLAHGSNPYTSTMASAARLLHMPSAFWTYTVAGGHVTEVSYPAGSFLLEAPAFLLGFHHQVVDWTDLFAWLLTGALIFVLLPSPLRWIGPLLVAVPIYADVFSSGGTDAAFLPFLVLAVWRWDRFGLGRSAGLARWVGPIALGLACSIKQTPWFCVPFIAIGLVLEARASGRRPGRLVLGYLAVVVGVFAAVNLPFIVWQPSAWAHGTLLPFTRPLVVDGQGLVTLALHGVVHGVSPRLLTLASALVYLALVAAFVVWYPGMKRIWMLLLPLTFFVAPRSLLSYLIDLYPAAVVAAVSVAPAVRPALVRWAGRSRFPIGLAVLVPSVAAIVVSVLAFASPPLRLDVASFTSSHSATSLDSVTVDIQNTTGSTVVPHFMVAFGNAHPSGFWLPSDRRPVVVGPDGSTVVTLRPPAPAGAPSHGSYWVVQAYTTSPEALSTSPLQHWRLGNAK